MMNDPEATWRDRWSPHELADELSQSALEIATRTGLYSLAGIMSDAATALQDFADKEEAEELQKQEDDKKRAEIRSVSEFVRKRKENL